ASVFIVSIVVLSLVSRALRSTELRVVRVEPDPLARTFIENAARGDAVRIIANRPGTGTIDEYVEKLREARDSHHLPADQPILFLEVQPGDVSQFSEILTIHGVQIDGYRVLRCQSPAVP